MKKLTDEYRKKTGREPVMIDDGTNFLRKIYDCSRDECILGGQVREFVADMKNFVAAFQVSLRQTFWRRT